jgi:hypothetical protein
MIVGGLAELIFGVAAERRSLEDIAAPLTALHVDLGQPVGRAQRPIVS